MGSRAGGDEIMSSGILACELTSKQTAKLIGVKYAALDYWCRSGALSEPMVPATGRGRSRVWGFLDVIRARAVARLRRDGVSLQTIRRVVGELTERYDVADPLANTSRLVVAGDRLYWAETDEALLDVLRGQLAARPLILLDIGELTTQTIEALAEVCAA